jgi:biotin carboxyl carrier protein
MWRVVALVAILVSAAAVRLAVPGAVWSQAGSPPGWLSVKSSLAGMVLEDHLVKVGDQVEDAQPLVYVRTALTGAVGVAARAPRDGAVREVLVKPGQRVERGDVVIRLQPK